MAQVRLTVGGRIYDFACRNGEEAHLQALAAEVDGRVAEAGRAVGPGSEGRQLVMAALFLADELSELRAAMASGGQQTLIDGFDKLADQLEALAERLEKDAVAS